MSKRRIPSCHARRQPLSAFKHLTATMYAQHWGRQEPSCCLKTAANSSGHDIRRLPALDRGSQIPGSAGVYPPHDTCCEMAKTPSAKWATASRSGSGHTRSGDILRQPAPTASESDAERRQRENKESALWTRATERIGKGPDDQDVRWVRVCDRGADIEVFMRGVIAQGQGFVVRAAQNRRLLDPNARTRSALGMSLRQPGLPRRLKLHHRPSREKRSESTCCTR